MRNEQNSLNVVTVISYKLIFNKWHLKFIPFFERKIVQFKRKPFWFITLLFRENLENDSSFLNVVSGVVEGDF